MHFEKTMHLAIKLITMIKFMTTLAFLFCMCTAIAQNDTSKANANMNSATIYFGYGTELTHTASVSITKNTKFIVIDKLSMQMDLNSLQISCPEDVSLLSQQFSVYTPPVKPSVENYLSKKIRDSIKQIERSILKINNSIDIESSILDKTDRLITSTIATSVNKTSLTAEALKLIEFLNNKTEKNKNSIFAYQQQIAGMQEEINELNIRLSKALEAADSKDVAEKSYGRITMQVVCRNDQNAAVSLSYYTNNAGWQPIYDIRVNSKTNVIKLVYKASIIQNTGIDWQKTKLTLSTGTPNFTTTAPLLNAWYLQYYVPQLYNQLQGKAASVNIRGMNSIQGYNDDKYFKKEMLTDNASEETVKPSTLDQYTTLQQGLLNTSFEIDLPYDIASNGLAHSINIKEGEIQSNLKNYAVPKLDADAYLLAEITNWETLDLIPGNANIIMDDTYIGKSFIDPNTTADTLNLSLGKDKRVAVKRTLIKDASLSKTKDAVTKQTFTYELVVKNNKVKDINMVLKDQYPLSNIKEIETILTDDGGAAVNTELGVLTWKINLKPGESKKIRFSYTIKYPKDKKILNLK